MTEVQFLDKIYTSVKPGMVVRKPNKLSKIIKVTEQGNIYYLIGTENSKAVTKNDLVAVYRALNDGTLTNKTIRDISGSARPCNATTLQWILREFNLAKESSNGIWHRTW